MYTEEHIISKKYASAFLNIYSSIFSLNDINKLEDLESFFKNNRYFYISLLITGIPLTIKQKALNIIVHTFNFKKPILTLTNLLLKSGRIEILDKVLEQIRFEYAKRNNIEFFTITSSHRLSQSEKEVAAAHLQSMTKMKAQTKFAINPKLIVGLRAKSTTSIWERSIRKELRTISKSIAKKGIS